MLTEKVLQVDRLGECFEFSVYVSDYGFIHKSVNQGHPSIHNSIIFGFISWYIFYITNTNQCFNIIFFACNSLFESSLSYQKQTTIGQLVVFLFWFRIHMIYDLTMRYFLLVSVMHFSKYRDSLILSVVSETHNKFIYNSLSK